MSVKASMLQPSSFCIKLSNWNFSKAPTHGYKKVVNITFSLEPFLLHNFTELIACMKFSCAFVCSPKLAINARGCTVSSLLS